MKVDFKITTWEQVEVDESRRKEVLAKLESGEITSSSDLCDFLEGDGTCKQLFETDEQMSTTENDGQSTIEVQEDGEYIFNNGE